MEVRTGAHRAELWGFLASAGGAGATVGLWVGFRYAFDLIFHFHPALVGLVGGWSLRRGLGGRGGWRAAWMLSAVTATLLTVGAGAIAAGGHALDPVGALAAVSAAGLAAGLVILMRA